MRHSRPNSVADALKLMASDRWTILAGGTDYYPSLGASAPSGAVLDITAIEALRSISQTEHGWRLGALTRWTDIINARLPPSFGALKLAAREVGSVQIQNRATVAGNLCNASPAADGVPPLLIMNADVELTSVRGSRRLPLTEFILGNRRNARNPDELLTAIHLPAAGCGGHSHFLKLGARRYLVISIAMVAVRLVTDDNGTITRAAVAAGACSEVARRLPNVESSLLGSRIDSAPQQQVSASMLDELTPIADVRATAVYRQQAALQLVQRALASCIEQIQ